jgi:precorrin-2 dehydrogenase/sirohydrochlorin ferrochelatase
VIASPAAFVPAADTASDSETKSRTDRAPGADPPPGRPAPFGFPIMVEVRGRRVVIAGGGHEPAGKAGSLARLGADVVVWAERHRQTAGLEGIPGIDLRTGSYDPALLDGALLAIVGTGDREVDHRIATDARQRHVLVNTVDDIPYCDWSAPAILRRGDLTISVASAGIAPALAVRVRDAIAELIGPEHGELLAILATLRPRIMATGRPFASRRTLWYELVDGPAVDLIRAGDVEAARDHLERVVSDWERRS